MRGVSQHTFSCLLKGGVDLNRLNAGRKNIYDLDHETKKRDVTLQLMKIGAKVRALRAALNVRGLIQSDLGFLWEICRRFGNNGELLMLDKPYGLSETRMRGESVLDAIVRGFREEYRHDVDLLQLICANKPELWSMHESTVYEGVMSAVGASFFTYTRDEPIWDDRNPIPDGNDLIHVRWIRPEDMTKEQEELLAQAVWNCSQLPPPGFG